MAISWYTSVKAPFGNLYAVAEDDRIVLIRPDKPRCVLSNKRNTLPLLTRTAEELRAYFSGDLAALSLPLPNGLPTFTHRIYARIAQIPYGETLDVHTLCKECGYPHSIHAVTMLCKTNPLWIAIPCHRVLLTPTGYSPAQPLTREGALRQMEKRYADTLTKPRKEGKL